MSNVKELKGVALPYIAQGARVPPHFHCASNPVVSSDAYWYCGNCCDAHDKKSDIIYDRRQQSGSGGQR